MTVRQQLLIWVPIALLSLLLLWALSDILAPFLAGAAIAYLVDPLVDRLQLRGLSRTASSILVSLAFLAVLVLAFLVIGPLLVEQIRQLAESVPGYVDQLQAFLERQAMSPTYEEHAKKILVTSREWIASSSGIILKKAWIGGSVILDIVGILVVTPIVAFYLLLDWDDIIASIDDILPRAYAPVIRKIARDIDSALAGFVRGQLSVCAILGVFYAIALSLTGLEFGLAIGLVAGILSFIPYVGSIVGGLLSIGLAIVQFWPDWTIIAIIAAIFVGGQVIEGNFLSPKLVGRQVGLHPVWLLFALTAFGYWFGFAGLLIAVPLAAAIGVLVRFMLEKYMEGPLYLGKKEE